jgi:hypothetical protein
LAIGLLTPHPGYAQSLFEFHSAFWMNLHHYLHALARASTPLVEDLPPSATDVERQQWAGAVEFYRTRFGKRRLVFDPALVEIKQALVRLDEAADTSPVELAAAHRQVLERAAPIYRKHLWSAHDAGNRKFLASLNALVAKHGSVIANRLARSYGSTWPVEALRVDIVRDAGPPGNAYTTNVPPPTHITMGADDQGLLSLELLFHEASHHWDQSLMRAVSDAAKELETKVPPELWHALLFYNAGKITADVLRAAGIEGYELYMVKGQVFARPRWHQTIAGHWDGFLTGEISQYEAVRRILRDLSG